MPRKYQVCEPLKREHYAALEKDILARGVQVPVELDENGEILDGHNRVAICDKHDLTYPTKTRKFKTEDEKFRHVRMLNMARRHMEPYEWGLLFEQECNSRGVVFDKRGTRNDLTGATMAPVADELGVPIDTAKKRLRQARQFQSLSTAQKRAVRRGDKTVTQAVREEKEARREGKRQDNAAKIAKAKTIQQAVSAAKFSTIVIDPPWDWSDEGDVDQLGRAKPTYKTMAIDELLAFPVGDKADDDCHLYLWITNRSLPKGFSLMEAWGFRYVTCLTWCKPSIGMGNYFRGSTEHVLFGVRGQLGLSRKDVGTWFQAERGKGHSSKPGEFISLVESCSPGPYLEIFARESRDGWTCWGGEL